MNYNVSVPIQRMLLPLVLAMVLYSGASSLHATGEGVQVVSNTTEIKIPFEVTFQFRVKSDVEIKDIRLNYRNEHGGNWNYSYLEFDSYTNVSSSFTLDLTGSNYIPPGSKIEYFYTITDVLGDLNLTDRTRFVVIDPRFSWRSTSVGNFTLWWHDQSSEKIEEITTRFQRSLVRLEKTLDFRFKVPINAIVYNSRAEADPALPPTSESLDRNQVFHGFAFADWNVFIVVGLRDDIITHEASHIFLDNIVSRPSVTLPAWLNEGFASYMESDRISAGKFYLSRKYDRPLASMNSVTGTPESLNYFYKKSESIVSFLFRVYGNQPFQSLISSLNDGLELDSALVKTYGLDRVGLEEEWIADTQITYSKDDKSRIDKWALGLTLAVALGLLAFSARTLWPVRPNMSG